MLISRSTAYLYDICAYYLAACTHDPGFQYSCRTNPRSFAKRREKFVTSPFFSPFIHVGGIIPVSGEIISSLSLFLSLSSTKEREVFDSLPGLFLPRQPESGRRARRWWSRERERKRERWKITSCSPSLLQPSLTLIPRCYEDVTSVISIVIHRWLIVKYRRDVYIQRRKKLVWMYINERWKRKRGRKSRVNLSWNNKGISWRIIDDEDDSLRTQPDFVI